MIVTVFAAALAATVVLDPGHGGPEDGARGPNGLTEKAAVLDIAKRARQRLRDAGVNVILTRADDRAVSLGERLEAARGADAFLSIHLNASPVASRRGLEVYVASVLATDDDTAELVAREEAGRVAEPERPRPPLDALLSDLDAQAAHRRSADLAEAVRRSLSTVEGLGPDRGLRQAPFYLLREAEVPSVLVEAGYASHPEQARFLASSAARARIAAALAQGILAFLGI